MRFPSIFPLRHLACALTIATAAALWIGSQKTPAQIYGFQAPRANQSFNPYTGPYQTQRMGTGLPMGQRSAAPVRTPYPRTMGYQAPVQKPFSNVRPVNPPLVTGQTWARRELYRGYWGAW